MQKKGRKKQLMEGEGMVVGVRLREKEKWANTDIPLVEKVKMQRDKIK